MQLKSVTLGHQQAVRQEYLRRRSIVEQGRLLVDSVHPVNQTSRDSDVNLRLSHNLSYRVVWWVKHRHFQLIFDFQRELSHLLLLTVHKDNIFRFQVGE